MSENSFTSIRNATIASLIAGILLLIVPSVREYLTSFFSWVWSGLTWCWSNLMATYALPGWLWIFIFLLAMIGALNILFSFKRKAAKPRHYLYVEDNMYGAIWRWQWVSTRISNLWCYCPKCEGTLVYDDSSCRDYFASVKKTHFICENCGHSIIASINGGNKDYAIGAVEREIDRRIRTNEYIKN